MKLDLFCIDMYVHITSKVMGIDMEKGVVYQMKNI